VTGCSLPPEHQTQPDEAIVMLKPEKPLHPLLSRTGTRTVFREVFGEDGDVGRACQRRAARCVRSAAVTPTGRPSTCPCVWVPPSPYAYRP